MKKYLIGLTVHYPDYEEIEIKAKNKTEARKKAQKIINDDIYYMEMEIDCIDEINE